MKLAHNPKPEIVPIIGPKVFSMYTYAPPEEGIAVRVNLRAANFDWGDMELSIPAGQSGPGVKSVGRVWLGVLGVSTNEAGEITATIVVFDPVK